ncbi:MAG: MBL fold metallo-hydrolase [Candidatus Micrarchaeota archaeon]|nr:MBL fold metallo-hydrolase [Candidatus Micrarchaeota archaeon]
MTFFGGAGEVGRNCVLVDEGRNNLLLDAGVKIGETDEYPLLTDEEIRKIEKIIISHTHLDHMGYLPFMYARGCRATAGA